MLSSASASVRRAQRTVIRSFATEHATTSSSATSSSTRPPPPASHTPRPRSRLNPSPRSTTSSQPHPLRPLPPNFGQNQLLSVPTSTRALLEEIVAQFRAPIRYAFAYGSGVFEQDGYTTMKEDGKTPMLDFMFAVKHPDHWHSINMTQHPSHYPLHARMLGSDFVSRVQEIRPGVWFNTHVSVNDVVR